MASKLGILLLVFLSIIFLPLLSALPHRIPGLHRHRHHHRLFRPRFFPEFGNGLEDEKFGDETFLHPVLDKKPRKTEETLHANGDDNENMQMFSNPALDRGKSDLGRGSGNEDDSERTSFFSNSGFDMQQNEEPRAEEPATGMEGRRTGGLREAFYGQSCPQAERIANETIQKHFRKDPTLAPAFVRLFFHDCFVTGCDGSVLLDTTPTGEDVEKKASHNGPLVRGFETIDAIKTQLEAECPGIVSCADILAFANRDALVFTGVPKYEVEAGRRDGLASLAKNVDGNLPTPGFTAQQNIEMFQKKGMSLEDLVVLIGAHSIGTAHCNVVSPRFHNREKSKEIDPGYLFRMQTLTMCQSEDQVVPFDPLSQHQMDSRFYKELLTNKALIEADHNLAKEPRTRNVMSKLVDDQEGWLAKFTAAIKKLGEVEVLTGDQGEIRKQCRAVNGDALV